jgi:competence protein ComFC
MIFRTAADLIFPRNCLSCNSKINTDSKFLCKSCEDKTEYSENTIQIDEPVFFDEARAVFKFNKPIQDLIHYLKYNEFKSVVKYLKPLIEKYFKLYGRFEKIDFIVPVPLHSTRMRDRGFNQATVIGKVISEITGIPLTEKIIKRNNYTKTQTLLSKAERSDNVSNVFKVPDPELAEGKSVLLVDDVFTTGSTVNSMSKLLKNNGVSNVFVLTVARA